MQLETVVLLSVLVLASTYQNVTYKGCYNDYFPRDISFKGYNSYTHLTVENCALFCSSLNFTVMGLQLSVECYCGNTYGVYGQALESNCSAVCPGNNQQYCGGALLNSVYQIVLDNPNDTKPMSYVTAYKGCFIDGYNAHDLSEMGYSNNVLFASVRTCKDFCSSLGYSYMGIQNGDKCYCGNSYGDYGKAPESECYVACTGNNREVCGGASRNSIYEIVPDKTAESYESGDYCKPPYELAGDNNCYFLAKKSYNGWYTHWDNCVYNGGNLVTLTDDKQLHHIRQFILDKMKNDSDYNINYFIDLTCDSGVYKSRDGAVHSYHPNAPTPCSNGFYYALSQVNFSSIIPGQDQTGSICQFFPPLGTINDDTTCPLLWNGVTQMWQSRNHCYYWMMASNPIPYYNARLQCKYLLDGDLADLSMIEDYRNFVALAQDSAVIWIGLHRNSNTSSNSYYTMDGEEIQGGDGVHTNWSMGYPVMTDYCGMISKENDGFLSGNCNRYAYYLCAKELPLPSDYGIYCRPPYELAEDGNCYWIRNTYENPVAQRVQCQKSGGDLVEIRSQPQYDALRQLLKRKKSYNVRFNTNMFVGYQISNGYVTPFSGNMYPNFTIPWGTGFPGNNTDQDVQIDVGPVMFPSFATWSTSIYQYHGAICHYLTYTMPPLENATCPTANGAVSWSGENSCFYQFNLHYTWHAARRFCQDNGLGDLAVNIPSLLLSIPQSFNIAMTWVGIHLSWKQNGLAHYYHNVDGTPLLDSHWKDGQPNFLTPASCAVFWNDFGAVCFAPNCTYSTAPCDELYGFICERKNFTKPLAANVTTAVVTTVTAAPTTVTITAGQTTATTTAGQTTATITAGQTAADTTAGQPPTTITAGQTTATTTAGQAPTTITAGQAATDTTARQTTADTTMIDSAGQTTGETTMTVPVGQASAATTMTASAGQTETATTATVTAVPSVATTTVTVADGPTIATTTVATQTAAATTVTVATQSTEAITVSHTPQETITPIAASPSSAESETLIPTTSSLPVNATGVPINTDRTDTTDEATSTSTADHSSRLRKRPPQPQAFH